MTLTTPAASSADNQTKSAAPLTWGVIICTFKREKILPRCLQCLAVQTRAPMEVIVVDASPYWDTTRDAVQRDIFDKNPQTKWTYVQATRASLTAQRNQGLSMATADIVFLIDDDSLMYPDCGQKITEAYEADTEGKIVGLTPAFVAAPPDASQGVQTPGHPAEGHIWTEHKASFLRRFSRKILWSDVQLIPYGHTEAPQVIPEPLARLGVYPCRFLSGSTTYRRWAIAKVGFEPLLERYAAGEDWDASYRLKELGVIAFHPTALQCHLEAPGGRLSRQTVSILRNCNFFALHVLHGKDVARSRKLYKKFMRRRWLSDLLADLSRRNWNIPRAKGTWRAWKHLTEIFSKSPDQLRQWYPTLQRSLIENDKGEERAR